MLNFVIKLVDVKKNNLNWSEIKDFEVIVNENNKN